MLVMFGVNDTTPLSSGDKQQYGYNYRVPNIGKSNMHRSIGTGVIYWEGLVRAQICLQNA